MSSLFREGAGAPIERMARYNVSRDVLDKLALYLREADDRELYKVNPRYPAAKLDVYTHTVL